MLVPLLLPAVRKEGVCCMPQWKAFSIDSPTLLFVLNCYQLLLGRSLLLFLLLLLNLDLSSDVVNQFCNPEKTPFFALFFSLPTCDLISSLSASLCQVKSFASCQTIVPEYESWDDIKNVLTVTDWLFTFFYFKEVTFKMEECNQCKQC